MSLTAKQPENSVEIIPEGQYQFVCYSVVDEGHQYNPIYTKYSPKVRITLEVPELRIVVEKNGEKKDLPRVIGKQYTNSLSDRSHLYSDLICWRGRNFTQEELDGFSLSNLLGANGMIQVIHATNKQGKKYAQISSWMKLPKGMKKLEPENPTIEYDIDRDGENIPEAIPDWQKEIIKKSKEFQGGQDEPETEQYPPFDPNNPDDIPF